MILEFYIPIEVKKYNKKKQDYVNDDYDPMEMIESIETGLCRDLSWPVMTSGLGFKYKLQGQGTRHITYRNKHLYLCLQVEVEFPTFDFVYDEENIWQKPDHTEFEKLLKSMISEINGDMGDGWGEGWEQRTFKYKGEEWSPTSGSVEFVKWCGLGYSKKQDKIIDTIYYTDKKKNELYLKEGWVDNSGVSECTFHRAIFNAAQDYQFLGLLKKYNDAGYEADVSEDNKCYKRYQKKINDLYVEYQVTKKFTNAFINYYLEKVKTGEYYGGNDIKELKEFQLTLKT